MTFRHESREEERERESLGNLGIAPSLEDADDDAICMPLSDKERFLCCRFEADLSERQKDGAGCKYDSGVR